MLIELIIIILAILYAAIQFQHSIGFMQALSFCIDVPSIISILILTLPMLARKDRLKDLKKAFCLTRKSFSCSLGEMRRALDVVEFLQKQILYAGLIMMLYPAIVIFAKVESVEYFGPSIAISMIALLYTAILELLVLPLQVEVKRRIIDYMEEE